MHGCRAAGVLCDFLDAVRCCDAKTFRFLIDSFFFWLLPAMMAMLFPCPRQALRLLDELRRFADTVVFRPASKLRFR